MDQSIPISVVIPNYNGEAVIPALLQSVQKQTYPPELLEVILVDDASQDRSVPSVRSDFPFVKIIANTRRAGAAYCKNRGVHAASHELILFLDSDIVLTESMFSLIIAAMSVSSAVCFQPKILFYDKQDVLNSTGGVANRFGYAWDRGIYEPDRGQYDSEKNILFASSAAMLISKKAILDAGLFDVDYFYLNEDYDLGYRLRLAGMRTEFVPEARCYHHMSHTMGRAHPRVKYLIERNRILTIVKNYEWKTIRGLFPDVLHVRLKKYHDQLRAVKEKKWQFVCAACASWLWLGLHAGFILYKRRSAQKRRTVSDEKILALFKEYKDYFPSFSHAA
jgi:GT2 family glycosyltransferase